MKKLSYLLSICLTLVFATSYAQNCNADFVASINGLTVDFNDTSTANSAITSWSWNFGNGPSPSTSTAQNPTFTYANAGSYAVCLTITDAARCTNTYCDSVTVSGGGILTPTCNISYGYWVDSLNNAYFTSYSSSTISSYSWDFGDGNTDTSANPTNSYSMASAYGVTLTIIDSIGDTCSFYDTVYVNYCWASFAYSVGASGDVTFSNYSGSARYSTEYTWDFGDNATSNLTSPTHTYASSGTYTVTLTLFDSLNNCTSVVTDSVVILLAGNAPCQASYTIALDSSAAFNVILFNTSTNASSHVYHWDFGDGTTGSGRTPIHTYQSFGSYEVCLTITDTILRCDTTVFCDTVGMDSLGNLKAGFGIEVRDPIVVSLEEQKDDFASLNIFPNPANNKINLDLRGINNPLNIRIMDLSGRIILDRKNNPSGNIETFDISQFSRGIYFMLLDNGSTQKVEKFIVTD